MIEIVPPVDPAEELKKQWSEEIKAKLNKMRRGKGFNEELEKAKAKVNKETEKQLNAMAIDKLNYSNAISRYHAFTRSLQAN